MIANAFLPWLCGVAIALAVAAFARIVGFDRDRSFYPTVLIVVASYYDLFAVLSGSAAALRSELLLTLIFVAAAVAGYRYSFWIVAAAMAGHGVMDFFHAGLIADPGVPGWWPAFCGSFDIVAGAWIGWLILSRRDPGAGHAASSRSLR